MSQLLIHLWGDYILQSDWMAQNKTKDSIAALAHALCYSAFFWLLRPSLTAWVVILGTHFLIDRFRVARYLCWAKNWIAPIAQPIAADSPNILARGLTFPNNVAFKYCAKTGYPERVPDWMAVWLMIIADNTLHITINFLALKYL